MIHLRDKTRRVSGSRLYEYCSANAIRSLVDPFMGLPHHLLYLKRHGIQVHGGDLMEWFVRAGEGVILNDFTILRDDEVAAIVERAPGQVYPVNMFRAWEGVFFSEEQCQYLAIWHTNVRSLRSDGQTGLAILGLWHVLCYWLQKANSPDEMPDTPPSELAWRYLRETQQLVCGNNARNTVRRADYEATLAAVTADCLYFCAPGRNSAADIDARIWMWEAWWQGNPYLSVEHYFRDTLFGRRATDNASYEDAIAAVVSAGSAFACTIVQTHPRELERFERIMTRVRGSVEKLVFDADEAYLIARA